MIVVWHLPLGPVPVVCARVAEPHVEVGWHDKGEEGDCARADEVKNVAEAWNRLGDEQQDDNANGAEQATLPVEVWNRSNFIWLQNNQGGNRYSQFYHAVTLIHNPRKCIEPQYLWSLPRLFAFFLCN